MPSLGKLSVSLTENEKGLVYSLEPTFLTFCAFTVLFFSPWWQIILLVATLIIGTNSRLTELFGNTVEEFPNMVKTGISVMKDNVNYVMSKLPQDVQYEEEHINMKDVESEEESEETEESDEEKKVETSGLESINRIIVPVIRTDVEGIPITESNVDDSGLPSTIPIMADDSVIDTM